MAIEQLSIKEIVKRAVDGTLDNYTVIELVKMPMWEIL